MPAANPFYDFVEDLFAPLGQIRIRKMFGGAGVYSGQDMFALIDDGRIYLKADDALKDALIAKGGEPFRWTNPKTDKTIEMSYVSMPDAALDDAKAAIDWSQKALDIAIAARHAKAKSPRRRPI